MLVLPEKLFLCAGFVLCVYFNCVYFVSIIRQKKYHDFLSKKNLQSQLYKTFIRDEQLVVYMVTAMRSLHVWVKSER